MKSTDVKEIYDSNYFLEAVDGYKEFSDFDGGFNSLFDRYQRNIRLLGLNAGHNFLEIGCGRGEVCIFHALQGGKSTGVDYSFDAISLARKKAEFLGVNVEFLESSFDGLRESPKKYDRILASEFIEHISSQEGEDFFKIAFSLLKPGGRLLVFTMPNTLQRRYGYPLQRLWAALRCKRLPKEQEDTLSEHYTKYHMNEQNYFSLKKFAAESGFKKYTVGYDGWEGSGRFGFRMLIRKFINRTFIRHIFFGNLYLLAEK